MSIDFESLEQNLSTLGQELRRLVGAFNLILEFDRKIFETSVELPDLFQQMLKGVKSLTGADYVQILLRHGRVLRIVSSTQDSDVGIEFDVDDCVSGLAVKNHHTISSGNVAKDYPKLYQWVLGKQSEKQMLSEVAVPVVTPRSERIIAGVLNVESPKGDAFSKQDTAMIEQFARQAGIAIHNAHIQKGLRLTIELAELLQSAEQKPDDVLRQGLRRLGDHFHENVVVQYLLVDAASEVLTIRSSTLPETEGLKVLVMDSFSGLVVAQGKSVRSGNVREDHPDRFKDTVGDIGHRPTQSELAVPIMEDGRITSVLNLESPENEAFSEYDEYVLSLVALNAGIWRRLHKPDRARAIESILTVCDVAKNLTHILRNELLPLGRIGQRLESLSDRLASDVSSEIRKEVENLKCVLSSIENRMIQLDKRYGRAAQDAAKINLNDTVSDVINTLITRSDIDVQLELDESLPEIIISPAIWDVVWNLVSNAQRAIDEGKSGRITVGTLRIIGRYTKRLEAFDLWVSDNGRGMSEEEQSKVFELGSTSKEDGGGFGMWWVKTFANRWDGEICLLSNLGIGTTWRLRFPFKPSIGLADK